MSKEEKTKIQLSLREKLIEPEKGPLLKYLGYLQAFLGDNDFMVGKSPTIADCQIVPRLTHLTKGILDGIPTTILDRRLPEAQGVPCSLLRAAAGEGVVREAGSC
ncbi:unnamed protein product [Prorocentrum cordatum]|uniref:Glutathione transferase n=1 Tax=Prorocentrum cordatum TaxID=2364126 RepID=A0ABN9S0L9_9DINO|nr:unnamed protein product [Polarella glacialis]